MPLEIIYWHQHEGKARVLPQDSESHTKELHICTLQRHSDYSDQCLIRAEVDFTIICSGDQTISKLWTDACHFSQSSNFHIFVELGLFSKLKFEYSRLQLGLAYRQSDIGRSSAGVTVKNLTTWSDPFVLRFCLECCKDECPNGQFVRAEQKLACLTASFSEAWKLLQNDARHPERWRHHLCNDDCYATPVPEQYAGSYV